MSPRGKTRLANDRGSALLLVVGATAVLAVISMALLTASFLAYEVAALEYQGSQARVLARSALELTGRELAAGRIAAPSPGATSVWQSVVPAAPAGVRSLPPGCGFEVRLTTVAGPAGPQQWRGSAVPATLLDAVAEGRCGRGFNSLAGRFALDLQGTVVRLY